MFPKIIHQTWKTKQVPSNWLESHQKWKELHPKWSYRLTSDEENLDFVKKHFPHYLNTYEQLKYPIQRADMIRYMYLYYFGGVYSDLDIVPTRPISEFAFDEADVYLCKSGNTSSVFTNSFIISKPGCLLWLEMLEHIKAYRAWPFTLRHLEIMYSTGPLGLTQVVKKSKAKLSELPRKLFMRFNSVETETLNCKDIAQKENVFNYPLIGNSWHSWDSTMLHYASKYIYIVAIVIVCLSYKYVQKS